VVVDELDQVQAGGTEILSYQIDYDMGTNKAEWNELKGFSSNDDSNFVIKDQLTFGEQYYVRYRAKNIYGWGDYSDLQSIYTIMVPDKPN
jgi:hypothetical protein